MIRFCRGFLETPWQCRHHLSVEYFADFLKAKKNHASLAYPYHFRGKISFKKEKTTLASQRNLEKHRRSIFPSVLCSE